ncbi:protein cereblon-like [Pollicipes pollicipes]|nr:protein cereblon-like [Pollicipes pollicipes]
MSLPLDDDVRARLLRLDSVVRRLRYEISIMRTFKVMACADCEQPLASSDDVFAMSAEGPQSIFVNPHGDLHETLTLHRASGLRCITRPSTEYSWFPGYAWEIAHCTQCSSHMGWRFTACRESLRPTSFWGLCRRSLAVRSGPVAGAPPPDESDEPGQIKLIF